MLGGAIIGVGFGFINIVFVVTTQAAVGWKERGAATASNQFMRQLGASIGTAAFGAVFNLGLYARVPNAGDVVTRMMNPLTRSGLSPLDVERYAAAIAASLHGIFIILALLGVIVSADGGGIADGTQRGGSNPGLAARSLTTRRYFAPYRRRRFRRFRA